MKNKSKLNITVSVQEAFNFGKREGMKEALRELKELAMCDEKFLNYLESRLERLEKNISTN